MEAFAYTFVNRFIIGSVFFFVFIIIKKIQSYITKKDEIENMYWYYAAITFALIYSLFSASAVQKVFMQAIFSQKWSSLSVVISYIVFVYVIFVCIVSINLILIVIWNKIESFIKSL